MKEKLIDAFFKYKEHVGRMPDFVELNPEDMTSLKNELSGLDCFVGDDGKDEIRIMDVLIKSNREIAKDTFILDLNKA